MTTVSKAGLVTYEKGLQAAVDKAAESQADDRSLDVAPTANLTLRLASGCTDPHFWLDPQRYSNVSNVIAARLSRADPAHKVDYEKNAKAFVDRLAALSRGFASGLATCQRKDLITSHAAFGYLAQRFDLRQVAINGLSPEQEPNASEIARVSTYAKANSVTTLYAQTLTSPAIATTVAREIGPGWPRSTRSKACPSSRAARTTLRSWVPTSLPCRRGRSAHDRAPFPRRRLASHRLASLGILGVWGPPDCRRSHPGYPCRGGRRHLGSQRLRQVNADQGPARTERPYRR